MRLHISRKQHVIPRPLSSPPQVFMRFCLPFARHFCKFKKEESHFVCQNPYFKSISKFFYPAVGDGLILKRCATKQNVYPHSQNIVNEHTLIYSSSFSTLLSGFQRLKGLLITDRRNQGGRWMRSTINFSVKTVRSLHFYRNRSTAMHVTRQFQVYYYYDSLDRAGSSQYLLIF